MKRTLTLSRKRAITGFLFVLPFTVGFLVFYARSIVTAVQMSLSDVVVGVETGVRGMVMIWNDFANYIQAFAQHATFKQDLTTSILNILIDVPLIIFFSLFMALFLNQRFRGRTVARAIFFLPVILGAPAISEAISAARAMMVGGVSPASAEVMASLSSGINFDIGYYLYMLGDLAIPEVIIGYIVDAVYRINNVITASGVQIVIFVAALQAIPPSLYEVAKIEGATSYETFWKVTFPMVSPLILTNVVYTIVDSFAYSQVVALSYSTTFAPIFNYGLGAVFSLVSSVAVCLILLTVGLLLSKRTFYQT
jgi:ABC-type sugar transport system permease subunit